MKPAPQAPEPGTPYEVAERWYFDLLRRELEDRGEGDAAIQLRQELRLGLEEQLEEDGGPVRLRLALGQRLTDYETRLNAHTGEPISWYADFLAIGGDDSTPREDALAIATSAAAPPETARLAGAEYEIQGDRVVFRARWTHEHDGLPVEGDYLEVLVNGRIRRAFGYARVWRAPDPSGGAVER